MRTQRLLTNLAEGLELPGELLDYHFLLLSACEELWKRRRDEPEILDDIERYCWIDIRLAQGHKEQFQRSRSDEGFLLIPAFNMLYSLYEREGALHEALEVAEIERVFRPDDRRLDEIRVRMAVEAGD